MARLSRDEKARIYWARVKFVQENPNEISDKEIRDYSFICGLIGLFPYGFKSETNWKHEKRNGRYTVCHQHHHKGMSRSGKTSYDYNWFDVLDHKTGDTFQVSWFVDKKQIGGNALKGYRKNIFEKEEAN